MVSAASAGAGDIAISRVKHVTPGGIMLYAVLLHGRLTAGLDREIKILVNAGGRTK